MKETDGSRRDGAPREDRQGDPISSARRRLSALPGPVAKERSVQLSGVVEEPVEGRHPVLRELGTGRTWVLTGGDPGVLRVGATVTVRGTVSADRASFVQQGPLVAVTHAFLA